MDGLVACSTNREDLQVTTHEEVFTDYCWTWVRIPPAPLTPYEGHRADGMV